MILEGVRLTGHWRSY